MQKLSERLGRQFFIENISGAGGNIGMTAAARAPNGGYTILLSSSSIVVNPSLYKSIPFNTEKDIIPVTKAGASPNSWEVNSEFPARSMKELIELMKLSPDTQNNKEKLAFYTNLETKLLDQVGRDEKTPGTLTLAVNKRFDELDGRLTHLGELAGVERLTEWTLFETLDGMARADAVLFMVAGLPMQVK